MKSRGNRNGVPADAARDKALAERRTKALDLRIAGKSYRAIGAELGISQQTAFEDVEKELSAIPAASVEKLRSQENERLEVDHERLERAIAALMPQAEVGDLDAAKALAMLVDKRAKLSAQRARLNGLDSPQRVEHSGPDGSPIAIEGNHDELLGRLARLAAAGGAGAGDPRTE